MAEFDVVVVGGGPAGLAATFYALQAQLRVALVAPESGGRVSHPFQLRGLPAVESVWGADLVQQFEAHVEARLKPYFPQFATGLEQRNGGGFQLTLDDNSLIGARSLILCTGARSQQLAVPGEDEFLGRGVSFSAVSHCQFFRGRDVAVIGGRRALPAVLRLTSLARRIYFVFTRNDGIDNSRFAEQALRHSKVFVFRDWQVQRITGDQFVTGLDLVAANGEMRSLSVEGVFVELGLAPNNGLVQHLVALDEDGHIIVNQRCETSAPGLFAAGDVTNVHAEQVPVAIGEGVKAALSAWAYLALHR